MRKKRLKSKGKKSKKHEMKKVSCIEWCSWAEGMGNSWLILRIENGCFKRYVTNENTT